MPVHRNLAASLSQTSLTSTAPSYSSSYLAELKASTQSGPTKREQDANPDLLIDQYGLESAYASTDLAKYGDASAAFIDDGKHGAHLHLFVI